MFVLFFNLYSAMFNGVWDPYPNVGAINTNLVATLNTVGQFVTSIFGDFQITDLGQNLTASRILFLTSFVLALITSIGIVVMAVKGVKKAFGIFFGHIR